MDKNTTDTAIILFDGVCNLCNSSIQFIIKRDKKNYFRFGALQSEAGKKIAEQYSIDLLKADSIVLIENGKYYLKSTAALRIARHLNGLYPLLSVFLFVPEFFRNYVYDFIARNRYRWFGKKDRCMVPSPEIKDKFIF